MAKRPSKHLRPARPLSAGHGTAEVKSDGRWIVRSIPGARAGKVYTCPGCLQPIPPGTAHVVAWPAIPSLGSTSGLEERRHWHTGCWTRKR
ncbi:MAG: hypothetical protein M0Z51_09705 [Propionibacterium sp.]|nr:hypothetical protein [Propionibacterium sp.]